MFVDIDAVDQCCYCVSGGIQEVKRYRIHTQHVLHVCVSTGSSLRFRRSVYVSDGSNGSVGNIDIT